MGLWICYRIPPASIGREGNGMGVIEDKSTLNTYYPISSPRSDVRVLV